MRSETEIGAGLLNGIRMRSESSPKVKTAVALSLYSVFLYVLTLSPFEFSIHWFKFFMAQGSSGAVATLFYPDPSDIINNIALFVPFGWILFALTDAPGRHSRRWFLLPLIVGTIVSASIETAQLFLDRSTSAVDFVVNVSGSLAGFYSAKRWHWHHKLYGFLRHLFAPFPVRLASVILYMAGLLVLLLIPFRFNRLSNWDHSYRLLVGNEATRNKPWNGDIHVLTLFGRALQDEEIRQLFRTAAGKHSSDVRIEMGAEAFYGFAEGKGDTVHDGSRMEPVLDLSEKIPSWLSGANGIRMHNASVLSSSAPAEKIIRAFQRTSSFTVEFLIRTRFLDQTGPARIVSISTDLDNRNVSLGQEGSDLIFRVRTPFSGPNSSRFYLTLRNAIQDMSIHHFAAVYNCGVMMIYRDGRLLKPVVRGDISYLPRIVHLGKNTAAAVAFCFLFFFLLGVLSGRVFPKRKIFWASACTAFLFVGFATFCRSQFSQPFGWLFFLAYEFFAVLGASTAKLFEPSA